MYKITFQNEVREFVERDLLNSHWNEMPNKPIKKLEYQIGDKTIILENYHAYNHLVERTQFINRDGMKLKLFLMAKKDNNVLILIYDLSKNKLSYDAKEFGKEYYGKPTTGWKEGIIGEKPKTIIK